MTDTREPRYDVFCGALGNDSQDVSRRFWSHVMKTPGCWLWTGITSGWYGSLHVRFGKGRGAHKTTKAHRVSFLLHSRAIPEGLYVLHHCDNKLCVNPDHLFLGTHGDNMRDYAAKKRAGILLPSGRGRVCRVRDRYEDSRSSRLSREDAERMRSLREKRHLSFGVLASMFGVSKQHVKRIVAGTAWRPKDEVPHDDA